MYILSRIEFKTESPFLLIQLFAKLTRKIHFTLIVLIRKNNSVRIFIYLFIFPCGFPEHIQQKVDTHFPVHHVNKTTEIALEWNRVERSARKKLLMASVVELLRLPSLTSYTRTRKLYTKVALDIMNWKPPPLQHWALQEQQQCNQTKVALLENSFQKAPMCLPRAAALGPKRFHLSRGVECISRNYFFFPEHSFLPKQM